MTTITSVIVAIAVSAEAPPALATDRAPLGPKEREAVTALLDAVDTAQRNGVDQDVRFLWDAHVLKSLDRKAFVPFAVSIDALGGSLKSGTLYVRAVARSASGAAAVEQRSEIRDWLRGAQSIPHRPETILIAAGEMPVGGPAVSSGRRSVQAPAEASTVLELQRRAAERDKARAEALRKAAESRDPSLFSFEEYYFFDARSIRRDTTHIVGRAIAVPPGEYDLYVALVDRDHLRDSRPVVLERRLTVPDFWDDELRLSSLILTNALHVLKAPLPRKEQSEQPYTFGVADALPPLTQTFSTGDVLTIVYQVCNYGAPGAELTADYRFYHVDGPRRLFNGTKPQTLTDEDLPSSNPWETQAFVTQLVPLASFPAGRYELEVTVHDRATRATTKAAAAFTVK